MPRNRILNLRPLSKLLVHQLKDDEREAQTAGSIAPAEKRIAAGSEARGRCSSADSTAGHRSSSLAPRAQPGRSVWCLEPPRARRCTAGKGEVARRLPRLQRCARPRDRSSAVCLLPLLLLQSEILVCGETGSPGGLPLTEPTRISFKPFGVARERNGGAEPPGLGQG